jgi:putative Mg2+ transporter-C (MgtC) family protein
MPLILTWHDIAARLGLTVLAGILIGINRSERGRPAGMRTTVLVCLAAATAMIQANLLLNVTGHTPQSFVKMDVMRLPLGILSGMGFIGAGAIVRRENMVLGVTTAATLWFVTVVGLCFGGGQFGLGLIVLGIGLIALWPLKLLEDSLNQDRNATLTVTAGPSGPSEDEIRERLRANQFAVANLQVTYDNDEHRRTYVCGVQWRAHPSDTSTPPFVGPLAQHPGVLSVEWKPWYRAQ